MYLHTALKEDKICLLRTEHNDVYLPSQENTVSGLTLSLKGSCQCNTNINQCFSNLIHTIGGHGKAEGCFLTVNWMIFTHFSLYACKRIWKLTLTMFFPCKSIQCNGTYFLKNSCHRVYFLHRENSNYPNHCSTPYLAAILFHGVLNIMVNWAFDVCYSYWSSFALSTLCSYWMGLYRDNRLGMVYASVNPFRELNKS